MRIILLLTILFLCSQGFSQTIYNGAVNSGYAEQNNYINDYRKIRKEESYKFKGSERSENLKQDIKKMRGSIGNSQNAVKARNLLLLQEVLNFKIQDETLAPEIAKLRENREFNAKLLKALNQLDNKKNRNRKNNDVMNILNEAGNSIYNSLVN